MNKILSIKKDELSLFIPLFVIMSCIVFNTKVLKILKDTIVVTTPEMGAELIPFLKTWLLIPISLGLICVVVRLMRVTSFLNVFFVATAFFLFIYVGYVFFISPIQSELTPHFLINYLDATLPYYLHKMVRIIEFWPICLFYVICDTWPIILLSMLFWKFTSVAVTHEQGKRFFPIFSIDIGGILMTPLLSLIGLVAGAYALEGELLWKIQLEALTLVVVAVGGIQSVVFYRLYKSTGIINLEEEKSNKKKVPIKEVLDYARSPFFGSLAIMIFMFEFSDNLFDVLWKDTLGNYHPEPENFSRYLGAVTTVTGVFTSIIPLVLTRFLLKNLSWSAVAIITPFLRIFLCLAFFGCLFFPELAMKMGAPFGLDALGFTVFVGGIQSCLMQMAKCTVFDNTKDLALMLAPKEEQGAARAFSDALATKFGKSSSCLAQQGVLMSHLSLQAASPFIACLIGVSIPLWLFSIGTASRYYRQRLTDFMTPQAEPV
ncbi:MAG: Npt1/Npt2 family nucleotide transporter [Chlamydiota bacterium]